MYRQGQYVVYGSHGVCQIVDIEEKNIDRKAVQYFVLAPLSRPDARYYIPVHNEIAVGKMRLPLTRQQMEEMTGAEADTSLWIAEENIRKNRYRELIANCDPQGLFMMVRLLRLHRQEQYDLGRKFHVSDANFLKDAEMLLASEIAFVLEITREEAAELI